LPAMAPRQLVLRGPQAHHRISRQALEVLLRPRILPRPHPSLQLLHSTLLHPRATLPSLLQAIRLLALLGSLRSRHTARRLQRIHRRARCSSPHNSHRHPQSTSQLLHASKARRALRSMPPRPTTRLRVRSSHHHLRPTAQLVRSTIQTSLPRRAVRWKHEQVWLLEEPSQLLTAIFDLYHTLFRTSGCAYPALHPATSFPQKKHHWSPKTPKNNWFMSSLHSNGGILSFTCTMLFINFFQIRRSASFRCI